MDELMKTFNDLIRGRSPIRCGEKPAQDASADQHAALKPRRGYTAISDRIIRALPGNRSLSPSSVFSSRRLAASESA